MYQPSNTARGGIGLAGFWDDLLQTGERITTQVLNRPQAPSFEPSGGGYYPAAYPGGYYPQQPSAMAGMLPLVLVGGLVLFLVMRKGRK